MILEFLCSIVGGKTVYTPLHFLSPFPRSHLRQIRDDENKGIIEGDEPDENPNVSMTMDEVVAVLKILAGAHQSGEANL